MTVSNVYVLHGVNFPGGQFLSELTSGTPATNLDDLMGYASGHPDPLFVANKRAKPDVSFSTPQVKTMLTLCGAGGMADLSAGNTDLYYKQATNLGERQSAASTVHKRFRMASGAVYWTEVSAGQDEDATLSGRICPIYNGTNAPLVPAGSIALAGTPSGSEFFTLGPVKVNGTELPGIKRVTISLGLTATEEAASGELYTSFCGVQQRAPVVTIETLQVDAWDGYGLLGTAISSLVVYLRRRDPDGSLYANGSSQHISFTASAGKIVPNNVSGAGNAPATAGLRCLLRTTSASSSVLTIATTDTIS